MTGGLVTLGETMGLLTPAGTGPLHHAGQFRLTVAGAESNVAIGARRLGTPATWIGRVGADEIGELVLRELRAERVEAIAVRDVAPTGLMLKTRRTGELSRVTYYRAGSAGSHLGPDDVDEDAVRAAGVLHVTGITPALGAGPAAAVRAAIDTARTAGVPVSLDVNYRAALWDEATAASALQGLIADADIVFAGAHEATLLGAVGEPAEQADAVAALGPRQAIVKLGARGCVARIDDVAYVEPAVAVHAIDPVGAGDAFVAGYLSDLLAGAAPAQRLATAAAVAGFAVTVHGDWEGSPTRDELALRHAPDPVVR